MTYIIGTIIFIISYIFGAFAFPQIIGSIRRIMIGIKNPFVFTLSLWTVLFLLFSIVMYVFMHKYFIVYLCGLIKPFVITALTKHIE